MAASSKSDDKSALKDFYKWVLDETMHRENVEKYKYIIHGEEDQSEHYCSDIVFIDVFEENRERQGRVYSLVIKYGQSQQEIREALPIRDIFSTEIGIYEKVIPRYHRLQSEKGLPLFSSAPKCYLTKFTDSKEVIVLDNLKKAGYSVFDKTLTMNLNHIKTVLEALAEWHALSFALEDQFNDEFLEMAKNFRRNQWKVIAEGFFGNVLNFGLESLYAILEENDELELLNKCKDRFGNKNAKDLFIDLVDQVEEQAVIVHGDCWNSNYMFQYKEANKTKPTKIALLDFQITSVRSPAFDLSHLIYVVSSANELKHLNELLHHYHMNLTNNLKKLGSDPEKIYPFETLKSHWKKYAAYGALLGLAVPMFVVVDNDNVPDFSKEEEFNAILPTLVAKPQYRQRVTNVGRHFVEYEF